MDEKTVHLTVPDDRDVGRALEKRGAHDGGGDLVKIEREIWNIRGNISDLIHELDCRRREALDVRLQFRRHPVTATAVAVALLGGLALVATLVVHRVHLRRERHRLPSRLGRLRAGLGRLIEDPDAVAPRQPSLQRRVATAGGGALATQLGRQLAKRLVHAR